MEKSSNCTVGGYCFAGNAAIAGCADVIIATEDSSMGMGGSYRKEEVWDTTTQRHWSANDLYQNGVIDLLVKDEAEAVQVAKQYLSYFQGNKEKWKAQDQTTLYSILPEDQICL